MTAQITHSFVSAIADDPTAASAGEVLPSHWNANHVLSLTTGAGQIQFNSAGSLVGMSGTSWDDTNRALTLTGATVTASNPIFNLSQTWNSSSVQFSALQLNVTNTASLYPSFLLNLQQGGNSQFSIEKDGNIFFGTNTQPYIATPFTPLTTNATVTISIATPAVVTWTAHGFVTGQPIKFTTTGALPTGITAGTVYYAHIIDANTFNISATPYGSFVATSGTQSGTQTGTGQSSPANPYTIVAFGPSGLDGSQTTPAFLIEPMWNTTGVATGFLANVTNIASGAGSKLMDLQVGGTSYFSFDTSNSLNITQFGAQINFNAGDAILAHTGSGQLALSSNGGITAVLAIKAATAQQPRIQVGLNTDTTNRINFGLDTSDNPNFGMGPGGSSSRDVFIYRQGTGIFAQTNGVNAQTFRVYNTTDNNASPVNYERGVFDWTTFPNVLTIGTQNGGTGTTRNLQFVIGGTSLGDFGISQHTDTGAWTFQSSSGYGTIFAYNPLANNTAQFVAINDRANPLRACTFGYAGTTNGQVITNGPSGEQGFQGCVTNFPFTLYTNNTARLTISGNAINAAQTGIFGWSSSATNTGAAADTGVARNVAGLLEINNGTAGAFADLIAANNRGSFTPLTTSATVTISIASPGVISWTAHGAVPNQAVHFSTTGALPTGITAGTTYYVLATGLTANAFEIAATPGGTAINTSGTQSGTHTATFQSTPVVPVAMAKWGPSGISNGAVITPALTVSQTWNSTPLISALQVNVTDITSGNGSKTIECLQNGNTWFGVGRYSPTGAALWLNPGLGGAQGQYLIYSDATSIWYNGPNTALPTHNFTANNSVSWFQIRNDSVAIGSSIYLGFTNGDATASRDTILWREGSGLLALSNSTFAQTFRVYNTSDLSAPGTPVNYERGVFDWTTNTNVLTIGTQKGGTGTTRNIQFVIGNTSVADYGITNANSWTFVGGGTGIVATPYFSARGAAGSGPGFFVALSTDATNVQRAALALDQATNAPYLGFLAPSGAAPGDTILNRKAAGVFAIQNGTPTSAAGLQIYNTSDVLNSTPTNYERGVFDWTTSANVLTIGTQAGGTGVFRSVNINGQQVLISNGAGSGVFLLNGGANQTVMPVSQSLGWASAGAVTFGTSPDTTISRTTGSGISITNGTVTASAPILTLTQTWNGAGVAFTGVVANITNTLSASTSLLLDLQLSSSSVFQIGRQGNIVSNVSSTGNPSVLINHSQTWNSVGTTFTGFKLNVTNTASAAGSLLMDLQIASASKFNVDKLGNLFIANAINVSTGGLGTIFIPNGTGTGVALSNFSAHLAVTDETLGTYAVVDARGLKGIGGTTTSLAPILDLAQTWNSIATTGASGTGTTATLTFAAQSIAPVVGSSITVAGVTPAGYNGTYTVTASTTTSVSYANTTTGAQTVAGTITTLMSGIKLNVTNTASATDSLLMDLQVGSTSVLKVNRGIVNTDSYIMMLPLGGYNTPAIAFGASSSGFYNTGSNLGVVVKANGGVPIACMQTGVNLHRDAFLAWDGTGTPDNANPVTAIFRQADYILAQVNSTHAQTFRVYNTTDSNTSPVNYERAVIDWTTTPNTLTFGTQAGGTGTGREVNLISGTSIRYKTALSGGGGDHLFYNGASNVIFDTVSSTTGWRFWIPIIVSDSSGSITTTITRAAASGLSITNGTVTTVAPIATWTQTWNSIATTGASGTGTVATLTFAAQNVAPVVGSTITVAGVTPVGYNGTFTVTASTTTSVSYSNTTTGAQTVAGTISTLMTGLKLNVTNTASVAGSPLMDLQAGGSSVFKVDSNAETAEFGLSGLKLNGVYALSWQGTSTLWLGDSTGGIQGAIGFNLNGNYNSHIGVETGGYINFANLTTAQSIKVYNTTDSNITPVNYERGVIDWTTSANVLTFGFQKGGTGTARATVFGTPGTRTLAGGEVGLFDTGGTTWVGATNSNTVFGGSNSGNSHARVDNANFVMRGNMIFGWALATGDIQFSSADTALARNAAGVVEVNNGTAGTFADLKVRNLTVTGTQTGGGAAPSLPIVGNGSTYTVSTPLLDLSETWNAATVATTGASGTGTVATLTFAAQAAAYPVGSTIVVAGVTPTGYNGTYTVTASSTTSVSYASSTTGAQTVAGTVQQVMVGIRLTINNTASAANSLLMDLEGAGSSFKVAKGTDVFFGTASGFKGVWLTAAGVSSPTLSNFSLLDDASERLLLNATNGVQIRVNNSTVAWVDTNNIVNINGGSVGFVNGFVTRPLQVHSVSATSGGIQADYFSNDVQNSVLDFIKSRSTSIGGHTTVASGDGLGGINFQGDDGTNYKGAASIAASVDATPSAGIMPGRITFSTTNTSGTSNERLRIDSAGNVSIGGFAAQSVSSLIPTLNVYNTSSNGHILFGLGYNGAQPAKIGLGRTQGANPSTFTAVSNGSQLGELGFYGADGTSLVQGAMIYCRTDNTVSTGIMPSQMQFWTMDSAGSYSERLKIASSGALTVTQTGATSTFLLGVAASTYNRLSWNGTISNGTYMGITGGGSGDTTFYFNVPTGGAYNFDTNQSGSPNLVIDGTGVYSKQTYLLGTSTYRWEQVFLGTVGIGTEQVARPVIDAVQKWNAPAIATTGASGTGTTATLTFAAQPLAFPVGSTIYVVGVSPSGYNGSYIVTASTTTSVSYANATSAAQTVAGTVQQVMVGMKFNVTTTSQAVNSLLLDLQVGGTTKFNVDDTGTLTIGNPFAYGMQGSPTKIEVQSTSSVPNQWSFVHRTYSADVNGAGIALYKSRSASNATSTNLTSGDTIGTVAFYSDDGSSGDRQSAYIAALADATGATNNVPGRLAFATTPSGSSSSLERLRIDNSGRIMVGGSASLNSAWYGDPARVQIISNDDTNKGLALHKYTNSNDGNTLYFHKSRATVLGNNTVLATGDNIGYLAFVGADGTAFERAATIAVEVDATPVNNTAVPGRIILSTAPNTSEAVERLRIDSAGRAIFNTSGTASASIGNNERVQIIGDTNDTSLGLYSWGTADNQAQLNFYFSSNNTGPTTQAATPNNSWLGSLSFRASDGVAFRDSARMLVQADALFSSGSSPGRILFQTTASGSTSLTERMRIDSNGLTNIGRAGASDSYTNGVFSKFEVAADNSVYYTTRLSSYGAHQYAPSIVTSKTRNTAVTGNTIVQNGDELFKIIVGGNDGTANFAEAARIDVRVDGVPGTSSMPARLSFSTTPFTFSQGFERVRIDNNGHMYFPNGDIGGTFTPISNAGVTCTITIASPAVVSITGHGFVPGQQVSFTTTGALPTGITASTPYYVIAAGLTANSFEIAATPGGTAINTSGTQSGTQTCTASNASSYASTIGTFGPSGLTGALTTPAVSWAQTWNTSGAATALQLNVTNINSGSGSKLIDLQVGGVSTHSIDSAGVVYLGSSTVSGSLNFHGGNATITESLGALTFNGIKSQFGATSGSTTQPRLSVGVTGDSFHRILIGLDSSDNPYLGIGPGSTTRDIFLYRQGGGILALTNSTTAQTFRVYNTTDSTTSPTNYERGTFDWSTTTNTLTIGTQSGGTGLQRNVVVTSSGQVETQPATVSGAIRFQINDVHVTGNVGFDLRENGTKKWTAAYYGAGGTNKSFTFYNEQLASDALFIYGDTGAVAFGAAANVNLIGLQSSTAALKVVTINSLSTLGYINWGGEARVTSDFNTGNSTTLTNVTGLSVNVQSSRTYSFEVYLSCTDAAAGGIKVAMGGTATATNIIYDGMLFDSNTVKNGNATALGTAVINTTTTATSGLVVRINGTITVNAAGTLTVQLAQNTGNATGTVAKQGSYMMVHDMP